MAVDHIRYDVLTQQALRGVVRTVLKEAAASGLPGEHHFYISFDTRAEGVRLSSRMRTQYPEEMTIVLQHQFWDLVVTEEAFEIGLSFGGSAERLTIPFAAVKGFFDPSVQFGLQFEEVTEAEEASAPSKHEDAESTAGRKALRRPAEHKRRPPSLTALPEAANPEPAPSAATSEPDKPVDTGQVVRLDRFRKK
ncbi:MAG: SspB family protein [Xanthobacteraceae bacterium]